MKIKDYQDAIEFFRTNDYQAADGAWSEFYQSKVLEPRIMDLAEGGRIGFKYGEGVKKIIKNSVGSPYGEGYHIMDYYSKKDAVPAKGGRGGKTARADSGQRERSDVRQDRSDASGG